MILSPSVDTRTLIFGYLSAFEIVSFCPFRVRRKRNLEKVFLRTSHLKLITLKQLYSFFQDWHLLDHNSIKETPQNKLGVMFVSSAIIEIFRHKICY